MTTSISSSKSWLFCGGCYDDEGGRSVMTVLGPMGLLVSVGTAWNSVEVCG
jgi:hypothetical protein